MWYEEALNAMERGFADTLSALMTDASMIAKKGCFCENSCELPVVAGQKLTCHDCSHKGNMLFCALKRSGNEFCLLAAND